MTGAANRPISLFYSYSHDDEDLRLRLQKHLAILRRSGAIAEWHDRNIDAGEDWAKAIDRNLETADVVLLLVSASFIASDYCWGKEMTKALERHDRGEATVIPVILKWCLWESAPFAKLQALPKNVQPVEAWAKPEEALHNVAQGIERVVKELRARRTAPSSAAATPAEAVKPPFPPQPLPAIPTTIPAAAKGTDAAIADFAVFRDIDAPWCPELVALPAGSFRMGSPESEEGRLDRESPQHRVTIGYRLAIGRYPVTVGEHRRFVEATGRSIKGGIRFWDGKQWQEDLTKSWRDPGFAQTDRHPVVGASWDDGQAYCAWLAKETGKDYRLLSEAEWEYACRAGTTTRYAFGDAILPRHANFGGKVGKTTEVGAYPANAWSLHDLHGNVWEWVEDVRHDSYTGAPVDGSSWLAGGDQETRVVRGGSWFHLPELLRSANRNWVQPDGRGDGLGFRVARTLSP